MPKKTGPPAADLFTCHECGATIHYKPEPKEAPPTRCSRLLCIALQELDARPLVRRRPHGPSPNRRRRQPQRPRPRSPAPMPSRALARQPKGPCPDCGRRTRLWTRIQPALFTHGGYGATLKTVTRWCRCGYQVHVSTDEIRPDRTTQHREHAVAAGP